MCERHSCHRLQTPRQFGRRQNNCCRGAKTETSNENIWILRKCSRTARNIEYQDNCCASNIWNTMPCRERREELWVHPSGERMQHTIALKSAKQLHILQSLYTQRKTLSIFGTYIIIKNLYYMRHLVLSYNPFICSVCNKCYEYHR